MAHTHHNPKRHMALVSLLLWRKMVAVCCFVWPPALVRKVGRQAGKQMKIRVRFKFYILPPVGVNLLFFNAVFDIRWTTIVPYHCIRCH